MKNLKQLFSINPLLMGIGLFSIPVLSLFITSLLFVAGLSINQFIFPISIILSLLLIFFLSKQNYKETIVSSLCILLIIAFSLIISMFFYDCSFDGQWYHQNTIFQLKSGWNPVYEHHTSNGIKSFGALYTDHYTKGLETIAATIYSTTENIETGKSANFILLFASIFFIFYYLRDCFNLLSQKKKILLSILFAFCPVVLCQIFTFYIDWAAYSLLLILVPSLICFIKEENKIFLGIIVFVVFLSATIKFNLFFWCGFAIVCYLVYLLFLKKYQLIKKTIIACVISSCFAVLLAGFNPYVTNMIDHKNPFYPLMGEDKVDIMKNNTPSYFFNKSRFEAVFISLISQPNNSTLESSTPTKLTFPFVKKSYFRGIQVPDMRIGGFGAFFSWALILSTLLYFSVIFFKRDCFKNKDRLKFSVFLLILFISLFILPYAWWARYFPFIYAFPLITCLYFEKEKNNMTFLKLIYVIYFILTVNTAGMLYATYKVNTYYTKRTNTNIQILSKSKKPVLINFGNNFSFKLKLDENKIKYKETMEKTGLSYLNCYIDSTNYVLESDFLKEK